MTEEFLLEALRRDSRDKSSDVRQRVARILTERSDVASLDLLVELAGDTDWRVRKAAIEGLEANPTEAVVRALIPALYDQANAGRRNAATAALGALGVRALPFLLMEIDRAVDADSRIALANVLGEIPADESIAALVGVLEHDKDVNVAATAVVSLGRLRRPEAVPALLRVLSGGNAWLHYHAIEALGELRAAEALPAIVALDDNAALRKAILEAAGKIGGFGAIDLLAARLGGSRLPDFPLLRAFGAVEEARRPSLLARRERDYLRRKFRENAPVGSAAALLLALKKTERPDRKADLLRALGWLGDREALAALISHLSSELSEVAERALEDFGPEAEPALRAILSPSADEATVDLILRILSRDAVPDALIPVLALLDHDSPGVRRAAVDFLARLADPRSVDYLIAHLGDGDSGIDGAAVDALSEILRRRSGEPEHIAMRIRGSLSSPEPLARANALAVLAETAAPDFRARVAAASKDPDAVVRTRAVTLAARSGDESFRSIFEHSVSDENALVRQAAASALGFLGGPEHRAVLSALVEDDDVWVRAAACRALGVAGAAEMAPRLARVAREGTAPERIAALEALGRLAEDSEWDVIVESFSDDDEEVRHAAMSAAAASRLPQAEAEIDRRTTDPDWRLRATALEAYGRRVRLDRRPVLRDRLLSDPDDLVARAALNALETLAREDDVPALVAALGREAIAEDVTAALLRLRGRLAVPLERAWKDADPRTASLLAEILRGDRLP